MNKFLAVFALCAVAVSATDLTPEELEAATQMSQASLSPSEAEEYKFNKYPEFNQYCTKAHDYVYGKFREGSENAKLRAWSQVFETLAPSGATAAQVQALINKVVKEHAQTAAHVPEQMRVQPAEVHVDSEALKKAIEETKSTNAGLFASIKEYVAAGALAIRDSVVSAGKAQLAALQAMAKDSETIQKEVDTLCFHLKTQLTMPLDDQFTSFKKELLASADPADGSRLSKVGQKNLGCLTAGRVQSLETFCRSAPAVLPIIFSFIPALTPAVEA